MLMFAVLPWWGIAFMSDSQIGPSWSGPIRGGESLSLTAYGGETRGFRCWAGGSFGDNDACGESRPWGRMEDD